MRFADENFESRLERLSVPDTPPDPQYHQGLKARMLEAFEQHLEADKPHRSGGSNHGRTITLLKNNRRFLALAAALIVLNLGGWLWVHQSMTKLPQRRLRVLKVTPVGQARQADRFTLLFDQDIASAQEVGYPVARELFEITPRPKGQWRWTAGDRMEFFLEEPLPPGRIYRIAPVRDLENRTGRKLVGPGEFEIRTEPLRLEDVLLSHTDSREATLELLFNQPVDPRQVSANLTIRAERYGQLSDGQAEVTLLTANPDKRIVLRASRSGDTRRLRVDLDRGLQGDGGQIPLGSDVQRWIQLPEGFDALRISSSWPDLSSPIALDVHFSESLDSTQDFSAIRVEPEVEELAFSCWGGNLEIRGRLEPSTSYTVHLPPTLVSRSGQSLGNPRRMVVATRPYRPRIRFDQSRGILSPRGNGEVTFKAVNVEGLKADVYRLYPNNLVAALQGQYPSRTSRPLFRDKCFELETRHNQPTEAAIEVASLVGNRPGIYRISMRTNSSYWVNDKITVALTDLALTAKRRPGGYLVWVTSISRGRPETGVEVEVRSETNQVLASSVSDAQGLAELNFSESHPDGQPFVLIARRGDELTYLLPDKRQWLLEGVDVTGRDVPGPYDVFLYGERGVYRPGDTIRLTGLVRSDGGKSAEDLPLDIQVTRPDGKDVHTLQARTEQGRQGFFHAEYSTLDTSRTGPWTFTARLRGSQRVLGTTHVYVEAFRPVRMEVRVETPDLRLGPDAEEIPVDVQARYLWDSPAGGMEVKLLTRYQKIPFTPEQYPGYTFGVQSQWSKSAPTVTGVLDEQGRASMVAPIPEDLEPGLYRSVVRAEITEPGGRTTGGSREIQVDRLGVHVGLRLVSETAQVDVDEPVEVRWVRLDGQGQPAQPGPMHLELERIEWDSYLEVVDGRRVWRSRKTPHTVRRIDMPAGSTQRSATFQCPRYGQYRIVARDESTGSTTHLYFWAWEGQEDTRKAMDHPERVEISLDRKSYRSGQSVRAVLQSPISGKALVCLESDRILWRRVIDLEGNTAALKVPLPEDLRGGAFLTATVVRALQADADRWMPLRAVGAGRIEMEYPEKQLTLRIESPDQARPGQSVPTRVYVLGADGPEAGAAVHLWAVDEGICLVTDYRLPAPGEWFLAHRKLGVSGSDIFYDLLPDFARPADMARIGADGGPVDSLASLRRSPVPTPYRDPAVVFHRVVTADEEGHVSLDLDMPRLHGRMRLMAVSASGDRYGQARKSITLKMPQMVEASWPRFAVPGDEFDVPVKLINTTDVALWADLEVDLNPIASAQADQPLENIELAPDSTRTIWLTVRADALGVLEGRLTLRPSKAGLSDTPEGGQEPAGELCSSWVSMPVRPGGSLHGRTKLERIQAGKSLTVRADDAFAQGMCRTRVMVSSRPRVHLLPAAQELIGYPYGCVEQTSSKLMALLYVPDLLGKSGADPAQAQGVQDMVRSGIARLWSMQTLDGGLAYWPGGTTSQVWCTAYAMKVLVEARQAGYEVDEQFSAPLVKYLEKQLRSDAGVSLSTKTLICRTLATFDKPDPGWMAFLTEQKDRLDIAGRAHLAAAWMSAGRRDRALELLDEQVLSQEIPLRMEGRITSRTVQEAVLLSLLVDLDPKHPWIPALMTKIDQARLAGGTWGATHCNAAVLAALAKAEVYQQSPGRFTGTIRQGREEVKFSQDKPVEAQFEDGPVRIETEGEGPVFVSVLQEGLAKVGAIEPHDHGLVARREWFGSDGQPIDVESLRVGDIVEVKLTLRSQAGQIPNVAMVDALPACMEVDMPSLLSERAENRPTFGTSVDRVEFLDDRVVLFLTAGQERVFRYRLRVTTAGRFRLPALEASGMYDPAIRSLTQASFVEVSR